MTTIDGSDAGRSAPRSRSLVRSVTIPTEHGGWGLTLEPALLGLLVAPSAAGVALGCAALLAFVARTPLKLALVDHHRGRRLPRTLVAERIAAVEVALLVVVVALAARSADAGFWVPLAAAAPLAAVELWFDVRSRSRRLVPELAGTIAIGSVAAAIALADGAAASVALGLWLVFAARAVAAVPFVRLQLQRAKHQPHQVRGSDAAQAAAVVLAAGALLLHGGFVAGLAAIVVLGALHLVAARRTPPKAAVLGAQQVVAGLAVVLATAAGISI